MFNVKDLVKHKDLLIEAVPKMAGCIDCGQRPSHYADVYGHILDTVKNIDRLVWIDDPMRDVLLMAALYHDIAKPDCKTVTSEIHFYHHDIMSADYWYYIAGKTYLIDDLITDREYRQVDFLIRYHMVLHELKKRLERGDSEGSIVDFLDPMICYLNYHFPNDKWIMINALIKLFRADMWASLKARSKTSRLLLEDCIDTVISPFLMKVIG